MAQTRTRIAAGVFFLSFILTMITLPCSLAWAVTAPDTLALLGKDTDEVAAPPAGEGAVKIDPSQENPTEEKPAVDAPGKSIESENSSPAAPVLAASTPVQSVRAINGWVDRDGQRYYYVDNEPVKGSKSIDEKWYRFDLSNGHLLRGSQCIDGKWYQYDSDLGFMLFGSQCIDSQWYRYDPYQGYLLFGSQYIDGRWYRYDPWQGFMLFGSQNIDASWYWYDDWQGFMRTGFRNIAEKQYYYDLLSGKMTLGKRYIEGSLYRFHAIQGYQVPNFRLYLDAGHGWNSSFPGQWDPGASGIGGKEANLTAALADDVARLCRERFGLDVYSNADTSAEHYTRRQRQAVDLGCSTFVSLHFNAGGSSGSESYVRDDVVPPGSIELRDIMHRYLVASVGLADRGKLDNDFAVVKGPLPSTLLEVCFIDNAFDMSQYNNNRDKIVLFLATAINEASKNETCIGSGL